MNTANNLILEVPDIFYPAFLKAVKRCKDEKKEMLIMCKIIPPTRLHIVEVATDKPEDYFFLGKYYATYRNEI